MILLNFEVADSEAANHLVGRVSFDFHLNRRMTDAVVMLQFLDDRL